MFHVRPFEVANSARHARLFELLRQQNLAAHQKKVRARQTVELFKDDHFEFRAERLMKSATDSLLRSA